MKEEDFSHNHNKACEEQQVFGVDLFCGAGGLTCGLEKAGIDMKLGIDVDPACEFPYATNNRAQFLLKSVAEVSAEDILTHLEGARVKLLAGCAPCQTFSTYNQKANSSDDRWWLLLQFARLIQETKPDLVTMENVPGLSEQDVFTTFLQTLSCEGYTVDYRIVRCQEYGLPQQRHRLVLLASRLGPIRILSPQEFGRKRKTVADVLSRLTSLKAGCACAKDPLHQSSKLSPLNLSRIRSSKPGGTWREWPENLIANCHRRRSGKTYPSVYGRMRWDKPAPTLTTQFFGFGNGRFGHPDQDRAISLREGAILQSFPKTYRFVREGEQVLMKKLGKLIGNAVPVVIGELIGKSIRRHLAETSRAKNMPK